MTRMPVAFVLAAIVLSINPTGAAAQRGTAAEAKAMLAKAGAHYKEVGRKQALADFTAQKAPFSDRDLYVFCIGPDGSITAHGAQAKLVGTPAEQIKDADGKPIAKALQDAAKKKAGGSVEYRWMNPVTHQNERKISFVQKLSGDVCGVGAYQPN
jgi:cytochrome c